MTARAHIVARGARTPLGLRSPTSAAALRAGISRVRELGHVRDRLGFPMMAALDSVLPRDLVGHRRLALLARTALEEVCEQVRATARPLQLPLLLALPEPRPGLSLPDLEKVGQALRGPLGSVEITEVMLVARGHAAGFSALEHAIRLLHSGLDLCLVGGVDSYYHPATLEWLDSNLRLAGGNARSAFVPGEAAAFLLVTSPLVTRSLGLVPHIGVADVATTFESKPPEGEDPSVGEGLTAAVRGVVGNPHGGERSIDDIICDINGERWRAEEWGFVSLRRGARRLDVLPLTCRWVG